MTRNQVDLLVSELADMLRERINAKLAIVDAEKQREKQLTLLTMLTMTHQFSMTLKDVICDKLKIKNEYDGPIC